MKVCTKCGVEKALEAYGPYKDSKDGLTYWCRECVRLACKAARQRKLAHYRAANRAWNKRNIEKVREQSRRYAARHPGLSRVRQNNRRTRKLYERLGIQEIA